MGGIHQFVPALLEGDATGGHVLEIRRLVRSFGLDSDIYVESIDLGLAPTEAHHFSDYPKHRAPGDVALYHLAAASYLADFLYARPEPLVIDYHNLTPAHFFKRWDPRAASDQVWGRSQVARLADRAVLALADSAFNQAELVTLGYGETTVVPILVDLDAFDARVDQEALDRLTRAKAAGGSDLLFVGRISPNKAQHDLVKALLAYRRLYDPAARLHLVGRTQSPLYLSALRHYLDDLGLAGAVNLAEGVTQGQLAAYYRSADALVSCSEHEGFCVPLLEAMHQGIPVVAYQAAAVPETLGSAGILVDSKGPLVMAAAIDRVINDASVRSALIGAGQRRLLHFSPERTRSRLVEALGRFLPGGGRRLCPDPLGPAGPPVATAAPADRG